MIHVKDDGCWLLLLVKPSIQRISSMLDDSSPHSCQRSVLEQEVVHPLCCYVESKGVEVEVDVACSNPFRRPEFAFLSWTCKEHSHFHRPLLLSFTKPNNENVPCYHWYFLWMSATEVERICFMTSIMSQFKFAELSLHSHNKLKKLQSNLLT